MWILALETTSNHGTLVLLKDDQLLSQRRFDSGRYAVQVHDLTAQLLHEHRLRLAQMELLAVADGPGSFTGVRIGLTAVKGWSEALGIPAVPISTLRAVAASAGLGDQPVLSALDASRGEIYYGLYSSAKSEEGLATAAEFQQLLAKTPGFTPHVALRERFPELQASTPDLAEWIGRLGWQSAQRGEVQDALRLDARYIRRSDAELFAPLAP